MQLRHLVCGLLMGATAQAAGPSRTKAGNTDATRNIGGITVIDTPMVRAAEQYARERSTDAVYGHIMRSWLYGVLAISNNETLSANVDLEVHAVGALLHDLGWDQTPNTTLVSPDKRFEVDGAIAAREFIRAHVDGKSWDEVRVQRVWDAIALHTETSIVSYKERDVRVIPQGITMDFVGPIGAISEEEYAMVGKAFPKTNFVQSINQTLIWLCHNSWIQPWGESYVSGYTAEGTRAFDKILSGVPP